MEFSEERSAAERRAGRHELVPEVPGAQRLDLRVLRFRTQPQREEPAMLAQALIDSERIDEAIELTSASLERDPADLDLSVLHGVALARAGRVREAQRVLMRAAQADPEWVEPWRHLAQVLVLRDRPEQAVAVAERALEIDPDDEALRSMRRSALLTARARQFQESPGDEEPALLAQELIAASRFAEALEVTRTALVMEMDDVDLLVAHARAARAMGDLDEAASALSMASFEAPEWVVLWRELAEVQEEMGAFEHALAAAGRAIAIDPGDVHLMIVHERVSRALAALST